MKKTDLLNKTWYKPGSKWLDKNFLKRYYKEYREKYYKEHTEEIKIYNQKYHKEHKEEINKRSKAYTREWHSIKRYGITVEERQKIFDEQEGRCAICHNKMTFFKEKIGTLYACVDHDHLTGKVRKLLCSPCNFVLGVIEKNKIKVEDINKYLQEFSLEK